MILADFILDGGNTLTLTSLWNYKNPTQIDFNVPKLTILDTV